MANLASLDEATPGKIHQAPVARLAVSRPTWAVSPVFKST